MEGNTHAKTGEQWLPPGRANECLGEQERERDASISYPTVIYPLNSLLGIYLILF